MNEPQVREKTQPGLQAHLSANRWDLDSKALWRW